MAKLTAKQESFIKLMNESEELARRGFELLLSRSDYEEFFDDLIRAGLFDPRLNPAPIPAEEKGYFRIPYWSALDYLSAVAKLSGERNDLQLANKVMEVVRSVSAWREPDGHPRENYHTAHKFALILGLVPTAAVTIGDLEFIPEWLSTRFEKMLVGRALDVGALSKFLESSSLENLNKAIIVLKYCTHIAWEGAKEIGTDERKPTMAVDKFWAREMIRRHARAFGTKIGEKGAEVFRERVREVFGAGTRKAYSSTYRPAIEDSFQNYEWLEVENSLVEGLREVLLSWCEADGGLVRPFVESLLTDELEILRRVGIYVLGRQWSILRELYPKLLAPEAFQAGHFHELYNLLDAHFADLTDSEKAGTLKTIEQIPLPLSGDDPNLSLKRMQHRWLAAIAGKNYAPADEWFAQLQSDPTVGPLPDHPDFGSYITGWVGPGPSPYTAMELVAFTAEGTAVEKLNAFEESDPWRGSTLDGLTRALEEAVRAVPDQFLKKLPDFLQAKWPFQHAVISGLKQEWETTDRKKETDWIQGWELLVSFFEQIVSDPRFWQEAPENSRRDWVVSAIADCLRAGTSKDERAFDTKLLPRTQRVIGILLNKAQAANQLSKDLMTQAINTPKGRVVEALFSQALRDCRASDSANGSHREQWDKIQPLFDAELAKCKNANYEFSVLCGAYIAQLEYMDAKWTKEQIPQIFPPAIQSNSLCAIDGLGYAPFTRSAYSLLVEAGVIDRGLRYDLKLSGGRGKLLERIAAAYLWGDEALNSPRFSFILEAGDVEDLETVTRTFWMVRGQTLSDEQKERILQYWTSCIARAQKLPETPTQLLSSLSMLTCYLATADSRDRELLEAVAPYVHFGHYAYEFVDQLVRLVEKSPVGVSAVLGKMIEGGAPEFDYDDKLKTLLRILAEKGQKQDVLLYAERLRRIPGMQRLFDDLTRDD